MEKKYDTLVLIGRFQPLHIAHREIIYRALELTRELVILIGSSDTPRTYNNPFNYQERKMMIENVLGEYTDQELAVNENQVRKNTTRVFIEPIVDYLYSDTKWAIQVQGIISKYKVLGGKTGIIGHRKDDTNYFDMFPQWELEEIDQIEPLHATDIRELYFKETPNLKMIQGVIPAPVFSLLNGWVGSPEFNQVVKEREHIEKYKQQFAGLAYPPIFVTSDAVVICSGHVLLIKRRTEPGKGLWAVPGGFVNANTDPSVEDAMIRELREETKIKVPEAVLRGSITGNKVFDAINRSARGRTITHAFKIDLKAGELPAIKGSDDAEKAKWVPIAEVQRGKMFEDHFEMIQYFVGA